MKNGEIFLGAAMLCFLLFGLAGTVKSQDTQQAGREMNGITLSQFRDFEKNWQLVTSRFRRDSGEMRITYANDIAWKAMQAGATDYPDGAVFAKIGLMTEDDPDFTSSAVPSGAKRYQFMVRDKKKFAETMGWGYAIFTPDGRTIFSKEDEHIESLACSACHEMVPHRGYVFSQPMALAAGNSGHPAPKTASWKLTSFSTVKVTTLPALVRSHMPPGTTEIRRVRGAFEKNVFGGTMGEIRPTLIKEVMRTRVPAALVSDKSSLFSLSFIRPEKPECEEHGKKGLTIVSLHATGGLADKNPPVNRQEHCEPLPQ